MKLTILTAGIFCTLHQMNVVAQTSFDDQIRMRYEKGIVAGAQIGSLICEDMNGKRVLCTGSQEETVLGIATNIPYVTINKPSSPDGSRLVFKALIDDAFGQIRKGDELTAGSGGVLVRCMPNDGVPYAVALDDASGGSLILVRILKR